MEIGLHVDVLKSALDELEKNEQASGSVVEESEESEAQKLAKKYDLDLERVE